ncbi:hypothetical protein WJX79_004762 [Trebouxia sp. C0005]
MSNSAEQQLLESSLAKLDARLSSLTAKSGGGQTTCPQAILPSSVSAPITRQPSLFLPPTCPTARPHGPSSRPLSVAASDGQHQGSPSAKAADRRPEAGLQLPELHPSPSVASAPCSGHSGSAVARGRTGPHGKAPGQQPVSVGNQEHEAMQSASSHTGPAHMQTRRSRMPALLAESSVLSAPVRNSKGIIKAYNLNALMA